MEIQEASAPGSLRSLRDEWNELIERCSSATIYQTWEWNDAWWQSYRKGKDLRILRLTRNGKLHAIAPLYVSRHLNSPLRRLAFVGTGASDYLDLIVADECAREASTALLEYLDRSKAFDLGDLQQLRPGSVLLEAAKTAGRDSGLRRRPSTLPQEPCPYLALPPTWEEFAKRIGKKLRSNVAYYERLLAKTFGSTEIGMAGPGELEAAMDSLFELHQKRWNARLLPGVLNSARVREFHREAARRFQARDWLRLHLIRIDGRIVSALYCFQFRKRYYYYLGGFSPELGKYSLGTVLTAAAIKHAIEEKCEEFDFLRGNEPYKYRWQPAERVNHRVLLADSRSLRSRAMVTLNRFERYVEHRAKEFAENRGRSKQK